MDLGLRNKVALVCGASRGLGRAIADELTAEGASLFVCARGEAPLQTAAKAMAKAHSVAVFPVAGDLSRIEDVQRVTETVLREAGRVDILVTNAGGPPPGPFESHGPDAWERATQLTLRSAIELIRAVLPGMKERRWGRILNVTSIAVKQPVDGLILSNSLRAAVTGMARTLANEVAPHGITVNNVLPGYTLTDRIADLAQATAVAQGTSETQVVKRWEDQIPARRLGDPRDLAALTAFLASERASYITGQSIAVDGGWIRGLL